MISYSDINLCTILQRKLHYKLKIQYMIFVVYYDICNILINICIYKIVI